MSKRKDKFFKTDQEIARVENLVSLVERGIEPFSVTSFKRENTVGEVLENFKENWNVSIAGRLVALRKHGGSTFGNILDEGEKIQIYLKKDLLGDNYSILSLLDIGDLIGIKGETFTTHKGEPTILIKEFTVLAKSLSPLPEKWHGLQDKEQRYRQRYIDFIANPEARGTINKRSVIIRLIRAFLDDRGFIEIETPILQPIYGGAFANPFKTYYQALNREFFLRISDELYLKRLICGGFNKVYEIGKAFRNEGQDRLHNPEFTMLELYEAYSDYMDMKKLTEDLFVCLMNSLFKGISMEYQGVEVDFTPPWKTLSYFDALKKSVGVDLSSANLSTAERIAKEQGVEWEESFKEDPEYTKDTIIDKLFGEKVIPAVKQTTFIMDYPVSISPLAKSKRDNCKLAQRFEPIICGVKIGNAFSELNDPIEQHNRFLEHFVRKHKGEEETPPIDEDFLRALGIGMPPTGGLGLGIDRIIMLLTNSRSIKEVIAFPQMRW